MIYSEKPQKVLSIREVLEMSSFEIEEHKLEMSKKNKPKSYKSYYDKLRDPKWQKKRLKVLERDQWKCTCCEKEDTELQVHHLFYFKDYDPWDYPNATLVTACKYCHEYVKGIDYAKELTAHILEYGFTDYAKWAKKLPLNWLIYIADRRGKNPYEMFLNERKSPRGLVPIWCIVEEIKEKFRKS